MGSGIKMDRILAMDCETSGLNWDAGHSDKYGSVIKGYQTVSWGLVAADMDFNPIAELYVEIKWDGISKWDQRAEEIHGLSKEYLEEYGMDEEEAIVTMVEFLMDNFNLDKPIYGLGHNAASFDLPIFRELLHKYEIPGIRFGHRAFDTFALSMGTVGELNSDALFKRVGLPVREGHNSLDDAKYALDTYRRINKLWKMMSKQSLKNSKKKSKR